MDAGFDYMREALKAHREEAESRFEDTNKRLDRLEVQIGETQRAMLALNVGLGGNGGSPPDYAALRSAMIQSRAQTASTLTAKNALIVAAISASFTYLVTLLTHTDAPKTVIEQFVP